MSINSIIQGTGLFVRFWDTGIPPNIMSYITPSPGKIKGINTSLVSGLNLGVSKYIDDDKKEAAYKVIEYFTSEKIQKELIINQFSLYTGIAKLYDEEQICMKLSCSLVKNAQAILYGQFENVDNYDVYAEQLKGIFDQYLFGDRDLESVLDEANDITRIYYFSLEKTSGLIIFIITLVILVSLSCLFIYTLIKKMKKNKKYEFLDPSLHVI